MCNVYKDGYEKLLVIEKTRKQKLEDLALSLHLKKKNQGTSDPMEEFSTALQTIQLETFRAFSGLHKFSHSILNVTGPMYAVNKELRDKQKSAFAEINSKSDALNNQVAQLLRERRQIEKLLFTFLQETTHGKSSEAQIAKSRQAAEKALRQYDENYKSVTHAQDLFYENEVKKHLNLLQQADRNRLDSLSAFIKQFHRTFTILIENLIGCTKRLDDTLLLVC